MLNCKKCNCIIDTHNKFAYDKFESGLCEDCFVKEYGNLPQNCHSDTYHRDLCFRDSDIYGKEQY